jgi:hypothetical protein
MKKVNIGQSIYIVRRGKQPSKVYSNAAKMCRAMADRPDFPCYEKVSKALMSFRNQLRKASEAAALKRLNGEMVEEVDEHNFDVVFTLWRIEVREVL